MTETSRFLDRFDRVDGEIGVNYLLCGGEVTILDEVVWPISIAGNSPTLASASRKVQVFYNASALDGPNYAVRAVWSHVAELPGIRPITELLVEAAQDPAFTVLARIPSSLRSQRYSSAAASPITGTLAEIRNQRTNELPLMRPTMPPARPKQRAMKT